MLHRSQIAHALWFWLVLSLLLAGLTGCRDGANDNDEPKPPDISPATNEVAPTLDPTQRAQVQTQYESLVSTQQALANIWRGVWEGEEVQCDTAIPSLLNPESIVQFVDPSLGDITALLRRAAIDLDRALTLWTVECESPRPLPPVDIVREGRDKSLSAGDALREAQQLMDALP